MGKYLFPEPGCFSCPYLKTLPYGRFCHGGKRPRRFKSKDPKIKAPGWRPRRNKPAVICVYRIKDEISESFHFAGRDKLTTDYNGTQFVCLMTHHYIKAYEGKQNITAGQFHEAAKSHEALFLIEFELKYGDVVEIDDGLKPYFFYFRNYQTFQSAYFTPPDDKTPKTRKKGKI